MFGWLQVASVVFSQALNVITMGQPGMTVSARAGYARDNGSKVGAGLCRVLDVVDLKSHDHCTNAIIAHEVRSQPDP